MNLDTLFSIASSTSALGWMLLVARLLLGGRVEVALLARAALWLGGRLLPVLLSVGYAAAIALWWRSAPGGFDSLDGVATLFTTRGLLLAGWVHYLAFDLWVGRWQIDTLNATPTPGWLARFVAVPCLLMTFLFGPVGLLMFLLLLRVLRGLRPPGNTVHAHIPF